MVFFPLLQVDAGFSRWTQQWVKSKYRTSHYRGTTYKRPFSGMQILTVSPTGNLSKSASLQTTELKAQLTDHLTCDRYWWSVMLEICALLLCKHIGCDVHSAKQWLQCWWLGKKCFVSCSWHPCLLKNKIHKSTPVPFAIEPPILLLVKRNSMRSLCNNPLCSFPKINSNERSRSGKMPELTTKYRKRPALRNHTSFYSALYIIRSNVSGTASPWLRKRGDLHFRKKIPP